jgi:P27 family predicted phage terminase small subunit
MEITTPAAQEFFASTLALLKKRGVDAPFNITLAKQAAQALDMAQQAQERMAQEGVLIVGHRNRLTKHPALMIYKQAIETYTKLASKLGVTPVQTCPFYPDDVSTPDPLAVDTVNSADTDATENDFEWEA